MTWDITTPANNEKIRNLGTVGRAHWEAIQNADLDGPVFLQYRSLQIGDRTALGVAVDPAVAASTAYIYSKNDVAPAAGLQELFIRDAASNIMQVTNDGSLGSIATKLQADSVSFDGTRTFNENNMVAAWGYCLANGTFQFGAGVASVTKLAGNGHYQVNFTAGVLLTDEYAIVASSQDTQCGVSGNPITTTEAFIHTRTTNSGTLVDANFYFIVAGGQT